MEELLASTGYAIKSFSRGDKIKAKLLRIGERSASFDIGGKSEGLVVESNFSEAKKLIESLKVGDEVTALVIEPENRDGVALLSLRNAAQDSSWKKIEKAYKNEEILEVTVKTVNPHGLIVALENESAFIPNSQLGTAAAEKGEGIVGGRIKAKIIDLDHAAARVVLSEKAVSEAGEIRELAQALSNLKEGAVLDGAVTTVTHFGAFVEVKVLIGKEKVSVEGLVHVSELSWAKVNRPEEVVSVGDKVKVAVLGIEKDKLSLSIKQAIMDPWISIGDKYGPDDKISGKVVRVSDFGAFVEIEPGIEGLIHMTKIPPGTSLTEGQEVSCYIEEVDLKNKKIALGLVVTSAKPIGYK